MSDPGSVELVGRWREGDHEAARELFDRYASRLIGLARSHLPQRMARRVESEDVVQSVFRSFFAVAQEEDGFTLTRSGDLWRLLAAMTLNKLYDRMRFHSRARRALASEVELDGDLDALFVRGPTPQEAVALLDELDRIMDRLDPLRRRMLEMRLQNYSLDEIAADTQRCERTVRRFLDGLKADLARDWASKCG